MRNREYKQYAVTRQMTVPAFIKTAVKTLKRIKKVLGHKVSLKFFESETKYSQALRLQLESNDSKYVFILREKKK